MVSPGHWRCGSQSPRCCPWLDQSNVAKVAPQTGEFGWGVGFRGLEWGWSGILSLLGCFVSGKIIEKVRLHWFGILGWRAGTYQVKCIGKVD